ncbi:MAG: glycosyltransferase [Bacteroidales bacterium]
MKKIVCFGPGPQFKGGIANYNTSLSKTIDLFEGYEVHIVSWTQQYPAIIPRDFMDRKSKQDQLAGTQIKVHYITNYNNPFSWLKTCKIIQEINPEKVIFQWSIAIQGLPLSYISRWLKKHTDIQVVFDLHFVAQKEVSSLDRLFLKKGICHADMYVVHSRQTAKELKELFPKQDFDPILPLEKSTKEGKPIVQLYHPVYDMFTPEKNYDVDAAKKVMKLNKHVFLFFGFIRKYKGLHNLIEAFARLSEKRSDVSLLIVGESFWHTLDKTKLSTRIKNALFGLAKSIFLNKTDDERTYKPLELLDKYNLHKKVHLVNEFVPNEDVYKYFQVSDSLVLFYDKASPSGVGSIAYNFNMPLLVTKIDHLEEMVDDGFNGFWAKQSDIDDMVRVMEASIESKIDRENVREFASQRSWKNYAESILKN